VTVKGETQAEKDLYTMSNLFAPRLGYVYDLSGNGKTVVKANYGFYWHNPGVVISQNANPNIASKSQTWSWNDQATCAGCIKGDKRWQPGEEVAVQATALSGAIKLAPDIKAPYSHEASVWVERQVSQTMGARVGFVYKTQDDLITNNYQKDRPISVYTQPFTFVDLGLDGVRGTADDRNLTMYGIPGSVAAGLSTDQYVMNLPEFGRYKTIEVSTNKRYGNKWSASLAAPSRGSTTIRTTIRRPRTSTRTISTARIARPGASRRPAATSRRTASASRRFSVISPGVNFAREATIAAPLDPGWSFPEAVRTPRESTWSRRMRTARTISGCSIHAWNAISSSTRISSSAGSWTSSTSPTATRPKPSVAPRVSAT
jgi:hypothetical protein